MSGTDSVGVVKVIVIGGTGLVGGSVVSALGDRHEVVVVSRSSPVAVDLGEPDSIDDMFAAVPGVQAVVCCAASVPLTPLGELTDDLVEEDARSKLFGQVALTLRATDLLPDRGSITLTGGTFVDPMPGGAIGELTNSGLAGFVRSAAADLTRGLRLNIVSPGWISETLESLGRGGAEGTPVDDVAAAYRDVVEGTANGQLVVPARRT
jgi:NAD(P)-dependent dehydrogenase (short-subunit alcohol dehydrogenase family)